MRIPNLPQALEMGLIVTENTDRDNSVLHVTDLAVAIGEGCARQLWLKLRGADKRTLTAGQRLMFWHGHRIHEDLSVLLEKGLPQEWEITGCEVKLDLLGIVGTADAIIRDCIGGGEMVVDYKTIRGRAFNFLNDAKPAHVLQVQTYAMALDTLGAMVLYVDREGQNSFRQFPIMRDDVKVVEAIRATKEIKDSINEPPLLEPLLEIKENKGPDSVKLKQPWNCDYCDYRDVVCHGALPYELRELGIAGHWDGVGFTPKKETPAEAIYIIEKLLDNEVIPF